MVDSQAYRSPIYTLNWSIGVHAYKILITYLLILINTINISVLSFFFKSENRRPLLHPASPAAVSHNKETPAAAHTNKEKIRVLTEEMYVLK